MHACLFVICICTVPTFECLLLYCFRNIRAGWSYSTHSRESNGTNRYAVKAGVHGETSFSYVDLFHDWWSSEKGNGDDSLVSSLASSGPLAALHHARNSFSAAVADFDMTKWDRKPRAATLKKLEVEQEETYRTGGGLGEGEGGEGGEGGEEESMLAIPRRGESRKKRLTLAPEKLV